MVLAAGILHSHKKRTTISGNQCKLSNSSSIRLLRLAKPVSEASSRGADLTGCMARSLNLTSLGYHSVSRLFALARTDFCSNVLYTLQILPFPTKKPSKCVYHYCTLPTVLYYGQTVPRRVWGGHAWPVWNYYSVYLSEYNETRSLWSVARASVCYTELEWVVRSACDLCRLGMEEEDPASAWQRCG